MKNSLHANGFQLKACWNDKQERTLKIVILGLDPGIQSVFNINRKDTKKEPLQDAGA